MIPSSEGRLPAGESEVCLDNVAAPLCVCIRLMVVRNALEGPPKTREGGGSGISTPLRLGQGIAGDGDHADRQR